ncbi:MAG TPA: hypothetical protein VN924_32575 [Bryobacteraceae bacterium]|jgi:uncharacterized protein|nr:hypothetical protein [Bryobacteraceae bacterium]
MKRHFALIAGIFLLSAAAVLAATDPAGVWEGTLDTPNGAVGFVFNVHRDGGQWAAEIDIPMQGVSGLPLSSVKVDGAAIGFPLPGPGNPRYDGKLSEDGKSISGTFTQGGEPIPLDLKWKSEPRAVDKSSANTGDVQVLEGAWEGVLEAHGQSLHVRFNFTKNADGSITATFDSVDQGANGLPIASIARRGDTLKLDMKAIGCSYEGTLNKDASTMTGTFTQGDSMPLNLQRKKAESKN